MFPAHREHDRESGLVHMRARMYEPLIGRFIQNDPIPKGRPIKHFTYTSNNPIIRHDPLGDQDKTPEEYNRLGGWEAMSDFQRRQLIEKWSHEQLRKLKGYAEEKAWSEYEARIAAHKKKEWDDLPVEQRVGKWWAKIRDPEIREWFENDPEAKAHFTKVVESGLVAAGKWNAFWVMLTTIGGPGLAEAGVSSQFGREAAKAAAARFRSLAWDPATKAYRWNEAVQAVRFERQFGITLTRSAHEGADFVAGETSYSFVGGYSSRRFQEQAFEAAITRKIRDKTVKVVIDVGTFTKNQARSVESFVQTLPEADRARIIILR